MRGEWHEVLKDGRRLAAKEGYTVRTTITPPRTLQEGRPVELRVGGRTAGATLRKATRLPTIGVGEIYDMIIAGRWSMPRTFQQGHAGRERWEGKRREPTGYEEDVRKIYEGLRHPGIPRWISDIVDKVAADTEIVGERLSTSSRRFCNRCRQMETITHKYGRCAATRKAWELMLRKWEGMTGEAWKASDEWITVWGTRWGDTTGRSSTGKEEAFRTIDAAMVVAIHKESTRKRPGGANKIFQRACALVQQMVTNTRHHRPQKYEEEWVSTGLACSAGTNQCA